MGLFKRDKLDRKLKKALGDVDPPTFPELHLRILRELRDPDVNAAKIAEVLQWDPGLVVRVLKVVNSAAFGPAQEVRDPAHAAALMGRRALEQLVTGVAVGDALPDPSTPAFCMQRFWTAAARRAVLARELAAGFEPAARHEAFTAGLLQDLALPVLASRCGEDYALILARWNAEPETELHVLERDGMGLCHAEIGAALALRWGLPEALVDAIGSQNDASAPEDPAVLRATRIVAGLRESLAEACPLEALEPRAVAAGVEAAAFRALVDSARDEAAELAGTLFGGRRAA